MTAEIDAEALIEAAIHDLASGAEALLVIATTIEARATRTSGKAPRQQLIDMALLVKLAVRQLTTSAAAMIRSAERLRLLVERESG